MNFNLTTIFGYSLQLTIGYYDNNCDEFTMLGLNLIKKGVK